MHPLCKALLVHFPLLELLHLDLLAELFEIALLLRCLGFLDTLTVRSISECSISSSQLKQLIERQETLGHSRLLDEICPDPFHMLVRLDHLGIVIAGSREWDIVLCSHLAGDRNLIESELVAGWRQSVFWLWVDPAHKAVSRCRSTRLISSQSVLWSG